ncbi:MAG: undecaprenyl-diphosphate phosphatase [Spirochaetaceae bacterium]|jgi:undecaprenyl-diphosphatase|nr:undecaprenyl-diphosphate phosphatase [Spirochaetaceae bacterium]
MSILQAVILGAVQGITEFLPVSSSGHLVLLQKIFGISEPALFFDTMLHLGTLAAVFAVLRKDILNILRHIFQPITGFLIIGTLPAVVIALLFKSKIEAVFESGAFLGFAFLLTALSLTAAEALSRRRGVLRTGAQMTALDSLVIGIMQGIAILPGVSRSGFTLSGALSLKLERAFAARFSFLLSIPAILGAAVLQIKDLLDDKAIADGGFGAANAIDAAGLPVDAAAAVDAVTAASSQITGIVPVIAGTLAAAIVGFFAVKLMLSIVQKYSLLPFAVYTAALGIFVLFSGIF